MSPGKRRLKIYLLAAGLAWAGLAALAELKEGNALVQSYANQMADGLRDVNPFLVLKTFMRTIADGFLPPLPPAGLNPAAPPPPPGQSQGMGHLIATLFNAVGASVVTVYKGGWSAWFVALTSLVLAFMLLASQGRNGEIGWIFHPVGFGFALVVLLASAGAICWLLQWLLIGILKLAGASLALVATFSTPILAIEAIRSRLVEPIGKVREIRNLQREEDEANDPPAAGPSQAS